MGNLTLLGHCFSVAALALAASTVAASDTDQDGVDDELDNCRVVDNPQQRDTDADGFGNRCDADFNNDGVADSVDLDYMRSVFFTADPLADLDGDGRVDFADLAQLKALYGASPGTRPQSGRHVVRSGGGATLFMEPSAVQVDPGTSITLDITADFTPFFTIGGGFDIRYDETQLDFESWVLADIGDPDFSREPDIEPGALIGIAFGDFGGLQGPAFVGTLTLRVNGGLPNQVLPDESMSITGPFLDAETFEAIDVEYVGTAVNVVPPEDPTVVVQPTEVNFGNVEITSSAIADIELTSIGVADLAIGNVADSDSLAAPFGIVADNCSQQTLVTSASCTVSVQFEPNGVSDFMDSFDIPTNDAETPVVTVTVAGTGTPGPAPDITLSPEEIDFSERLIGTVGFRTLYLRNFGNADLTIGNVGDTDPLGAPFAVTIDTCSGTSIEQNGSCEIGIEFTAELGSFSDTLNIPSNDPATPQAELIVLGEGVLPPPPDISGTVQGYGAVAGLICINRTTGQRVQALINTDFSWSCERTGLVISPGDQVDMFLRGKVPETAAPSGARKPH